MKLKFFSGVVLGLAIVATPFIGGCRNDNSTALAQAAPAGQGFQGAAEAEPTGASAVESASVEKVEPAQPAAEKPLPSDIQLSADAAQIVKLAQAGVDESVMLSFVKNSTGTFNLGSDEIIYLNDLGVVNTVVTAMLEHDRAQGVSQTSAPPVAATQTPAQSYSTTPTQSGEGAPATTITPPTEPVSVNYFYSSLAPYGSWVEIEGYGRCWQPTVVVREPTWQPYCDRGHWVYTDCGWYWYSDYSWGYSTFHYGRWFRHPRYGWCWNPDTVWGPAWVTWRYSNDYCGWAPLPPHAYYRPGIGFSYYDRSVGFSFDFGLNVSCFTFVPFGHFFDHHPRRYAVPRTRVTNIYNNTTVINNYGSGNNNTVINHGVPVTRVAAATHTTIKPVAIRENTTATHQRSERLERHGNETVLYRPPTTSTSTQSESRHGTETRPTTPGRAVLPRTNPGEERRHTETTTVRTPTTTREEGTSRPTETQPTTHGRAVLPRTNPGEERRRVETTPSVIPSTERRGYERRPAVQPRTPTVQPETVTRSTRESSSENALIIPRGRSERPTVTTPEQSVFPRSSAPVYTPPRFESPRARSEISQPTVASPGVSFAPRVERQESSRSVPVISHHENPAQSVGRGPGDQGQSSRSTQSPRSQSRGDSRSDKKSKD